MASWLEEPKKQMVTGGNEAGDVYGPNPNYASQKKSYDKVTSKSWSKAAGSSDKRKHYQERNQYTSYTYGMGKKSAGGKLDFGAKYTGYKNDARGKAVYETDKVRQQSRQGIFEAQIGKALGKSWKGNEWMKKATDKVWKENLYGVQGTYLRKTYQGWDNKGTDAGPTKRYRGYGTLGEKDLNRLSHTMTTIAASIKSGEDRDKETEKRTGEKESRGGMGSRGSTIMTGGHQGVLGKARTRRQTLMGRHDAERGTTGSRAGGSRRHHRKMGG